MTTPTTDDKQKKFLTPVFRMSFPNLAKPRAVKATDEPKYSLTMIFPKKFSDPAEQVLFDAIMAECRAVAEKKWGPDRSKWPTTNVPDGKGGFNRINAIMSPWHDGTEKNIAGYGPDVVFAAATSKQKPGIVGPKKGPDGKPEVIDADPKIVYGGCYARARVTVYPYDRERKGVALGLRNIQVVRDGEPLGGSSNPQDDFDAIPEPTGATPVGAASAPAAGGFGV